MKEEVKRQWVNALRSGKYIQGEGKLKQKMDDGVVYCCLGVLCEIVGVPYITTKGFYEYIFDGASFSTSSMTNVYFADDDRSLPIEVQNVLTDMNDHGDKDFNQIADWIEETL